MSSFNPECNPLKEKYDKCFNNWYTTKYLKGDTKEECTELFKEYKACVWKHIKEKQVDKLINDVVKENNIRECKE